MTTRNTVQHVISKWDREKYQSLPGKTVTEGFIQRHGMVVMTDAASSLKAWDQYVIDSVAIEPQSETLFQATIEYHRKIFICEACGAQTFNEPGSLFFDRVYYTMCWCGEACKQTCIKMARADIDKHRQEAGDDIIEAAMCYLRLRQAPPMGRYMTEKEWELLSKRCDNEYRAVRSSLALVFMARVAALETQQPTSVKPAQSQAFAAIEASPMSLFDEEAAGD